MASLRKTAAEPAPASLAELTGELHRLTGERLAHQRWIQAFPQARQRLIDAAADDSVIDELETEQTARERAIDRAIARERQLAEKIADRRNADRALAWEALRDRYAAAAETLAGAADDVWTAHAALTDLVTEACTAGFGPPAGGFYPPLAVVTVETSAQLRAVVASLANRSPPVEPAAMPTMAVRFVRSHGAFVRGDLAGFPKAAALQLAQGGIAEIVEPRET